MKKLNTNQKRYLSRIFECFNAVFERVGELERIILFFVLLIYAGIAVAAESPVNPSLQTEQTEKSEVLPIKVHSSSCLPFGESCISVEKIELGLPKTKSQPPISSSQDQ